jgi:hypothetical protein
LANSGEAPALVDHLAQPASPVLQGLDERVAAGVLKRDGTCEEREDDRLVEGWDRRRLAGRGRRRRSRRGLQRLPLQFRAFFSNCSSPAGVISVASVIAAGDASITRRSSVVRLPLL